MEIRPAEPEDAEAIETMRVAGWKAGYRGVIDDAFLDAFEGHPDQRREYIVHTKPPSHQLVAVDGGEVVGWIAGMPSNGEENEDLDSRSTYEIKACYVDPAHWRFGIGRQLMDALVSALDSSWHSIAVWTLRDTPRSVRFYEANGFVLDGKEMSDSRENASGRADFEEVRLIRAL